MKQVKVLIVLLVIIILTGCTKEYNLIVENDKITEEFNISVDNTEENEQRFNLDYFPLHANEKVMYNKTLNKEDNLIKAKFDYTYKPTEFVNANTVNECFGNKEIIVDNDDYYYFKLSSLKECMSDYNLDINIITKNKVLEHNADESSNNKYTWHLTNENKEIFDLEIKIDKKNSTKNDFSIVGIIGIIILLLTVGFVIVFIKKSKSNKI